MFPDPEWAAAIVGAAGPSSNSSVRGAALDQGTNVYSGDTLDVGPEGDGIVTFGHNALARFSQETSSCAMGTLCRWSCFADEWCFVRCLHSWWRDTWAMPSFAQIGRKR